MSSTSTPELSSSKRMKMDTSSSKGRSWCFAENRKEKHFVDKTDFLLKVFCDPKRIKVPNIFISGPRDFGKTYQMDMCSTFADYTIGNEERNQLFEGTKAFKDSTLFTHHAGHYCSMYVDLNAFPSPVNKESWYKVSEMIIEHFSGIAHLYLQNDSYTTAEVKEIIHDCKRLHSLIPLFGKFSSIKIFLCWDNINNVFQDLLSQQNIVLVDEIIRFMCFPISRFHGYITVFVSNYMAPFRRFYDYLKKGMEVIDVITTGTFFHHFGFTEADVLNVIQNQVSGIALDELRDECGHFHSASEEHVFNPGCTLEMIENGKCSLLLASQYEELVSYLNRNVDIRRSLATVVAEKNISFFWKDCSDGKFVFESTDRICSMLAENGLLVYENQSFKPFSGLNPQMLTMKISNNLAKEQMEQIFSDVYYEGCRTSNIPMQREISIDFEALMEAVIDGKNVFPPLHHFLSKVVRHFQHMNHVNHDELKSLIFGIESKHYLVRVEQGTDENKVADVLVFKKEHGTTTRRTHKDDEAIFCLEIKIETNVFKGFEQILSHRYFRLLRKKGRKALASFSWFERSFGEATCMTSTIFKSLIGEELTNETVLSEADISLLKKEVPVIYLCQCPT